MSTTGSDGSYNWTVDCSEPNGSMETNFKVGDRVEVHGLVVSTHCNGKRGEIYRTLPESDRHFTRLDSGSEHSFSAKNLRLIDSPQPQQNQTKEEQDMKPYAVIFASLSTGTSAINSQHITEAEAKEAAEMLVAGQRADLTKKQYFTVTIVNTKTGELVGSVTDAPLAVDWAKK